jgi:HlyB family type I secretion system ABC transporter
MIHPSFVASEQEVAQLFSQAIGYALSTQEWATCSRHIQLLEPAAGKPLWQTAIAGIYLILKGKVRLLDGANNLVVSLEAGASLGESTLFPGESFQAYTARASVNVQICFIPEVGLRSLLSKYPALRDRLYERAVLQDLLILSRQAPSLNQVSVEKLVHLKSQLELHSLPIGNLPRPLARDSGLWFLRKGELLSSSSNQLTPGIYVLDQFPQSLTWQVTQAAELYSLNAVNWKITLRDLPELSQLAVHHINSFQENQTRKISSREEFAGISHSSSISLAQENSPKRKIRKAYFPSPTIRLGHWWQRTIRRYPFFAQQSASDCGAACLVMIGRYWGKRFSVNRLRDIANVDRNGASLRGLAAAAESIGFSPRPVKASLSKLAEQSLPAIAHWEGRHFIVVYEITRRHVVVGDPAIGQRTLSHAEFKAGWTGYTLLLQPTVFLKETPEANQLLWQFVELLKPHWLVLLEVFIASIFLQILGLVTPLFTQLLLDRVIVQRSELTLTTVGLGMLIFGIFRVVLSGLRQYLLGHTANRVDLALIVGFIKHTFHLPLGFFESRYVGDIISRIGENYKIQRFLTGDALSILLDFLTVFIYLGLMFWYSWKMALLTLVIVPPFALLALISTPLLKRISRQIFNDNNSQSRYLIQALTGIRTVKGMAIEQTVGWHWEDLFAKSVRTNFSGQIIGNMLQLSSSTVETLVTTALLWFGAWQVIQNKLTIGQLVAFNMLLGNVISPFRRLSVLWNQLQEVVIAVERIQDVIDTEPEEDYQKQTRQFLPTLKGHVCFEQVTFRYHPESDVNVLENISFAVQPGQMVALVGRSGSGKTTISKLLLGLYPATEGRILIDDYDINNLALRSLRQQIGVVDQDTFLFGGTIRENISVGHPEATLGEVIEAATQAGAHSFIEALPMGYETQIGEGGGMLSGGQRQRLAIARALLGNPRLLILDEATSHLDAESERIIQNNLNAMTRDRTTLVIAHRLSTIRNADLILVLDRGVLIERGMHDELMARRGHYYYLNQQQLTSVEK